MKTLRPDVRQPREDFPVPRARAERLRAGTGAALAAVLWAAAAQASEQDLGTYRAWRAHAFVDGKQQVCSMWSQPTSAKGDYTRRGEIFAFVTHRPGEKVRHKISFEMGYDVQPGLALKVRIDEKAYSLVTSGSTAWTDEPKVSRSMVDAMKVGKEMVVAGVSSRGTKTTDTYSLLGFTAAYEAISKACAE